MHRLYMPRLHKNRLEARLRHPGVKFAGFHGARPPGMKSGMAGGANGTLNLPQLLRSKIQTRVETAKEELWQRGGTTTRDAKYLGAGCERPQGSRGQADRILQEYGLPPGPYGQSYEIDHLIPLDLGGSDEDSNLWPEPRRSIEPVWNAERKDRLEWRMADMVCGGQLGLAAAQKAIRDNWVDAYRAYIGER
jgi:hypothetical protein